MSNPGTGGRGKTAPYRSQHYRIPEPIKPVVEMLANAYRQSLAGDTDPDGKKLLRRVEVAIALPGKSSNPENEFRAGSTVDPDDDPDNDPDDDPDDDLDEEPSDDEIIKIQANKMQKYITEIRMLERELKASQDEVKQLKCQSE